MLGLALFGGIGIAAAERSRYGTQILELNHGVGSIDSPDIIQQLQDWVNSERTPLEYTGIAFTAFAIFYLLKTYFVDIPSPEDYHKARSALIQLIKTYEVMSTRWIHRLGVIDEAESAEAEYTFLRRQDELQTSLSALLHTLQKNKSKLKQADGDCCEYFADFMFGWLKVFRQCSPKPLEDPHIILSDADVPQVERLGSMTEIAGYIGQRLQDKPVSFVATEMEEFRTKHMQRTETLIGGDSRKSRSWLALKCGGIGITSRTRSGGRAPFPLVADCLCIKMEMLSAWHCRLLLFLIFGLSILLLLLGTGDKWVSIIAGVGVVVILAILFFFVNSIDEHARLVWDAKKMETEMQEAERELTRIETTVDQMAKVLDLWRYQTLPRLELYNWVLDVLVASLPQGRDAIKSIAEQMKYVEQVYGNVDLWTGPTAVPVGWMKAAAKQLADSALPLQETTKAKDPVYSTKLGLDSHFAIVTIVVLAAHNLPDMDEGKHDLTDAFVVVKVGKEHRRTKTISDNLNPRWADEKFILTSTGIDRVIKMEVYDDDGDEKKTRDLFEAIGFVEVPFRAKPGEWVWRKERLQHTHGSRTSGQKNIGDLEFRFHFAQTMQDCAMMNNTQDEAPGFARTRS